MKKVALIITLVIGMATCTFAQEEYNGNHGLFGRGGEPGLFDDFWSFGLFEGLEDEYREGIELSLPGGHGNTNDFDGSLGSGVAVLLGLGGAYLVAKKRKEE